MASLRSRRSRRNAEFSQSRKQSQLPPEEKKPSETGQNEMFYSQKDSYVTAVFAVLAIISRFYRISTPPAVVFDELHFSKFVDRLLTGTWFFDIHPPLGKLILAYGGYILGYRPDPSFVIDKIGTLYPRSVKYVLVRSVSATFSVCTVPLTYVISRNLTISRASSILATSSVLFDFLGLIEGRLILMDSQLLFFCQTSLLCALRLWKTEPRSAKRWIWLTFTGFSAGAALSIKHTALATPGLIALVSFFGLHFLKTPLTLLECFYAGSCGLALYASTFFVMFNLLWKTGGKYDRFMPLHFRRTLLGAAEYDPAAKRVSFLRLFWYLNRRMVQSNANIKKRHTWESDWYHWIVNWRGVLYYLHKEARDNITIRTQIYLFGNPVVTYLTLFCVGAFVMLLVLCARYRNHVQKRKVYGKFEQIGYNGVFLLSGWLCNLLPYILVDRAAFIYHYIPGLFYGQLLAGLVLDLTPYRVRTFLVGLLIACMFTSFLYWSPWVYAVPLTNDQHVERRWLPRWT